MSLAVPIRLALRELRGGLKGFRVFLACLALGVAAIAAVGSVRESIDAGIEREGAVLLGGDAEIQLTYRFATPEERAALDAQSDRLSEIVDFRSMATVTRDGETERGLTQVKGVDDAYPLVGEVRLDPPMPLADAIKENGAVMDPLLMNRLGLAPGDTFRLGSKDFTLTAALIREPDDAGGGFGLGPRTLLRTAALEGAGLIQPGTLYETAYRLDLPPGADLDATRRAAEAALEGAGIRWRDARNGAPGVSEFVDRLSAFLVLVGLAGLAVGGVGVSAAVRSYLDRKTHVIATLKTLGAETRTIFAIYAIQIAALTALGLVLGLILGAAIPLALAPILEARLPVPAVFALHPGPLAEAALYGALTAVLFTLWPLAATEQVRAAALYRDASGRARLPRPRFILATLVILAVLVGAAAWLSGLPTLTVWSAAGLLGAFAALVAAALGVRRLARWLAPRVRRWTPLRLALGSAGGPGSEAPAVVLSLGLGLTVLAAVGQIDTNLRDAIARDLPEVAPSFFVVDIQNDQLAAFRRTRRRAHRR
jgi:putative ABC transport system permease protein